MPFGQAQCHIISVMDFIFRQLLEKESSTYTYIVGDSSTKEAFIIDPVIETMDRDLSLKILNMSNIKLFVSIREQ